MIAPVVNAGPLVAVVSVTDFAPVVVGLKATITVHVSDLRQRRALTAVARCRRPRTATCQARPACSTSHSGSSPVLVTSQERLAGAVAVLICASPAA